MVRRSIHTAEQLRELILQAATDLVESNGLAGLSAREIAKRINYSPGTLYNVFKNLDDLILRIEERVLDRLDDHLNNAAATSSDQSCILRIADAYLQFAAQNPKLWNLLLQHEPSNGRPIPDWYQEKFEKLQLRFETALATTAGATSDPTIVKRSAQALFYAIHGVTTLSTAKKVSNLTDESAASVVRHLTETCLGQIAARQPSAQTLSD